MRNKVQTGRQPMPGVKYIIILLSLVVSLFAKDIVVYNNEYNILKLDKKIKKLVVGNRDAINVSVLSTSKNNGTLLKIFGKKTGSTSILVVYRDGTMQNYHVYINENLGFIQKMINVIEPNLQLSKVGDGSTVISGTFENPHDKSRIFALLESAGIDMSHLMDLTDTKKVNKMVRTKLYLVEINNNKAKDLGGITGMSFFNEYVNAAINPLANNGATFSGWLLDNMGDFTAKKGNSVAGTLNFLEQSGIGKILDDTVLITTEDENASFRVGGEVYIPTGMTQNAGLAPTIELEEKEYGLKLVLTTKFMERDDFMHIEVDIKNSQFDTDVSHNVALGNGVSVPSFTSKNIQTNVVIRSGQVLALGGRLHTEDIESEEKIPLLGDIPLLGELFTHRISGVRENDLLFFLVPEIVDANEQVDDLHYYKEYKDETKQFHREALDLNAKKKKSIVVLNEEPKYHNIQETPTAVSKEEDEDITIELEDNTPSYTEESKTTLIIPHKTELTLQKEMPNKEDADIVIPEQETQIHEDVTATVTTSKLPTPSMEEQMPSNTQESTSLADGENINNKPLYEVATGKIFLRSKPLDGRRVSVWKKGHKFTVADEKEVEGKVWYKIKEDCYDSCKETTNDLWISSKYVEEI